MKPGTLPRTLFRGGLVVNSVMLSVALVIGTTLLVAIVMVLTARREIQASVDRRLSDGAAFFQSHVVEDFEELLAGANWLTRDREFLDAVYENRPEGIRERLGLASALEPMDELVVADAQGEPMVWLEVRRPAGAGGNISQESGFRQALVSGTASGIIRGEEDFLRQVVYRSVPSPVGAEPFGVIRLASFMDQVDLERFRRRSGLDASLFLGQARVATTLRQTEGIPLNPNSIDLNIYGNVVGTGAQMYAWQALPGEEIRSYYLPVAAPDGTRVGMVSVDLTLDTEAEEFLDALVPMLPMTLIIVLAGATLAYLLASRVRGPVVLLAGAAARLRDGDLSTPVPKVKEAEIAPIAEQLELARRNLAANLEAIAREEARQRALFAALREAVLTVSMSGQITGFNRASGALFGDPERLQGRALQELLPFAAGAPDTEGTEVTFQGSITDATGHTLDVEVSRTNLSEGHLPASQVYVIHDVSRYAELNRLREELLYDVSHELRGPLGVLENALDILASEFGSLSAKELAQLMDSAVRVARRLRRLMEDLLSAGAIQAGRFIIQVQPTEVREILEEAIETVEPMIEVRRQHVERQVPGGLLYVLADQHRAAQALANLLSNASKYSPDGEVIRVHVARGPGLVRVTVEDRGPGIPADKRAALFGRFYRIPRENGEPGIGLGLAIAKGIVEAHGGSMGIDSDSGAGTRAWFTLPEAERLGNENPAGR